MSSSARSTSDKALRVGVIGLGWAGRQHLEAYQGIEGVEVVGLAGKEADLLAELGAAHHVPGLFAGWEELIALPGLDAVSVAVPTFLHAPIAIAALDRGLHVLSEKPIARNAAEGQQMVDAARRSGRVLDVAFNHRRRGDIGALKKIIDAGELGRPYYAKAVLAQAVRHSRPRKLVHQPGTGRRRTAGRHRRACAGLRPLPTR